jgi:hypothetical protein
MVFARQFDKFIGTRKSYPIIGTTPSGQLYPERNLHPSPGPMQKHMPALTLLPAARGKLTATNQAAGLSGISDLVTHPYQQ